VEPAKALFIHALEQETGKRCLYITNNHTKARKMHSSLQVFEPDGSVFLPGRELMPFDVEARSHGSEVDRVSALYRLAKNDYRIAVAPVDALLLRIRGKNPFLKNVMTIKRGSQYLREKLEQSFITAGYEKCEMVESEGQFAIRGDILDIYSPGWDNPCRVDFFGDEVEKIKEFDPETQLSENEKTELLILPLSEQAGGYGDIISALKNIEKPSGQIKRDIEKLENGLMRFPMDKYFGLCRDADFPIGYIDRETMIVMDNDMRCLKKSETLTMEYGHTCEKLLSDKAVPPEACNMAAGFYEAIQGRKLNLVMPEVTGPHEQTEIYRSFDILTRENPSYGGRMEILLDDVRKWKHRGRKTAIVAPSQKSAGILSEFFRDNGIDITGTGPDKELRPGTVAMLENGPAEGFEILEAGLCVIGSGKIFRKSKKEKDKRGRGMEMDLFADLKPGDHVVHDNHGVGRYIGIENLKAAGTRKDYLKIEYRGSDILYIPVTNIGSIQKYIGSGGKPRLSKMGGKEWERTKEKVKSSVKDIARELVELYAKRKAMKGHRYSPDTVWQVAFEEEFPYEETPDQLRCTDEIKEDMESDTIMDRLLCGDVGYGKTEVALRAAFKAVMDGKQVAFLAPTTVLAYQHFNTFTERMGNFPVSVDLMCRFRTKKQMAETISGLRAGTVDIVVGTHRLLQKDVGFKNLGLLVIDEEQRFGVEHKETIKNYKNNVDVLTLTATPIPRTLHMSLSGIRDISVIEDPPAKRFPVQTYVMGYDEDVIRDAVEREKDRGGQVFYLYNRVADIERKYNKLSSLLGEGVSIGIAHGQMEERKLEQVMIDFVRGEYDVLLCTTIIESGLDIPNVNTLIIEDADRMGLSQLYQIRGRVGRSDRVAYAYITHRSGKEVTEEAAKRLEAIREFTEFGSGFRIAMRDLEIRGAGNLLGANQHGHMEKVGYDLYVRILNRAIRELGGEAYGEKAAVECTLELDISAYIDGRYIRNELQRLEMYKKIGAVSTRDQRKKLVSELEDRFGPPPTETLALLDAALVKNTAEQKGIESISMKGDNILFTFTEGEFPDAEAIAAATKRFPDRLTADLGTKSPIRLKSRGGFVDMGAVLTLAESI
jgi:transcription-repair coupling factor (superfamily II helicase)